MARNSYYHLPPSKPKLSFLEGAGYGVLGYFGILVATTLTVPPIGALFIAISWIAVLGATYLYINDLKEQNYEAHKKAYTQQNPHINIEHAHAITKQKNNTLDQIAGSVSAQLEDTEIKFNHHWFSNKTLSSNQFRSIIRKELIQVGEKHHIPFDTLSEQHKIRITTNLSIAIKEQAKRPVGVTITNGDGTHFPTAHKPALKEFINHKLDNLFAHLSKDLNSKQDNASSTPNSKNNGPVRKSFVAKEEDRSLNNENDVSHGRGSLC